MSIDAQGMSRLYCVWNWSRGFFRTESPRTHIFAGENVCIQVITPAQVRSAVAASSVAEISSALLTVGFHTIGYGTAPVAFSPSTIAWLSRPTCSSVSGP